MTDASSSSSSRHAPSPAINPLTKLGHLSASASTISVLKTVPQPSASAHAPHLIRQHPCFKVVTTAAAASSLLDESPDDFNYNKSSPTSNLEYERDQRASIISCLNTKKDSPSSKGGGLKDYPDTCNDGGGEFSSSSSSCSVAAYHRYQDIGYCRSTISKQHYCDRFDRAGLQFKSDEEGTLFPSFKLTSLQCYSRNRTSPYLDQGYHTLVSPSPPGCLPTVSIGKCKKFSSKYSHNIEKVPDVVLLQIFSWLSTNELCLVSRVCRRWYNLAWNDSLWKIITLQGEGICADKAVKNILQQLCHHSQDGSCSNVKQFFVFDGAKFTNEGLSLLSRKCSALTHVQLQNCSTLTDSAVSELVTKCPGLQRLDLTGCSLITCIVMVTRSDLPQKLLLQHLDLTDCVLVQDFHLQIILHNCPLLTYLYLRRCCKITDAGIKFVPSFCSSLRELSVSDCHLVTDFALYELAKLGSNLRYLSVAKCGRVSDAGLKVIAKRCYKLRYLNVRGCEAVSDDALIAVARSCPRLRSLDIGKCDVSDTGLKVLAENCPNLKKLSLRNCDLVTDRGIQYVCYYCRGLQQLNIQDCQISMEGYKAVKKFCKRCIIEHTNPGFF